MNTIDHALTALSAFLEPSQCVLCDGPASPNIRVCAACGQSIDDEPPLVVDLGQLSGSSTVFALGAYSGGLERAVIALKRSSPGLVAQRLAHRMAEAAGSTGARYRWVTWIPGSVKRIRKEGFDHGQLLARLVASAAGATCVRLLSRNAAAKAQHELSADMRESNADMAFKIVRALPPPQELRSKVLIVDDVMTTGASMRRCARLVSGLTDQDVDGAVIARADRDLVC